MRPSSKNRLDFFCLKVVEFSYRQHGGISLSAIFDGPIVIPGPFVLGPMEDLDNPSWSAKIQNFQSKENERENFSFNKRNAGATEE